MPALPPRSPPPQHRDRQESALLRVTSFGTFMRGTPSSYTLGSTCGTDSFDERHRTNGEKLAPMTSPPIIEAWKLIEFVDVTIIDSSVSFTTPATSTSRFETVSPVPPPGTGLVSQRERSSLSMSPGCPRVRYTPKYFSVGRLTRVVARGCPDAAPGPLANTNTQRRGHDCRRGRRSEMTRVLPPPRRGGVTTAPTGHHLEQRRSIL